MVGGQTTGWGLNRMCSAPGSETGGGREGGRERGEGWREREVTMTIVNSICINCYVLDIP